MFSLCWEADSALLFWVILSCECSFSYSQIFLGHMTSLWICLLCWELFQMEPASVWFWRFTIWRLSQKHIITSSTLQINVRTCSVWHCQTTDSYLNQWTGWSFSIKCQKAVKWKMFKCLVFSLKPKTLQFNSKDASDPHMWEAGTSVQPFCSRTTINPLIITAGVFLF